MRLTRNYPVSGKKKKSHACTACLHKENISKLLLGKVSSSLSADKMEYTTGRIKAFVLLSITAAHLALQTE